MNTESSTRGGKLKSSLLDRVGFIVAFLLIILYGAGCRSKKANLAIHDAAYGIADAVYKDGLSDPASRASDGLKQNPYDAYNWIPPCGGTVSATGTTPLGVFTATDVHSAAVFLDTSFLATDRTCRISVTITDRSLAAYLTFYLFPDRSERIDSYSGHHSVTANLWLIQQNSFITTTGEADITSVNNPYVGTAPDAHITGNLEGNFTFLQDGFSITGTFSSPFCSYDACQLL